MDVKYYYIKDGIQYGPILPSEFAANGVDSNTMVWCSGMTSWQPVSKILSLSGNSGGSGSFASYSNLSWAKTAPAPPEPDNHLLGAILTTLFCCFPLGIVTIIMASKVKPLYYEGKHKEAIEKSNQTEKWVMLNVALTLALAFIVFIIAIAVNNR